MKGKLILAMAAMTLVIAGCTTAVPEPGVTLKGEVGVGLDTDMARMTVEAGQDKISVTINKNSQICKGEFTYVAHQSVILAIMGSTRMADYEGSFSSVAAGCSKYVEGDGKAMRTVRLNGDVRNLSLDKGIHLTFCTTGGNCILPFAAGSAF